MANQLLHRLSIVGDLATKRVIKQFAAKYHFVYFGFVDSRSDEHELVRGVTASTSHVDNHYSVGTFRGHDITLLERRNHLTFPGKPPADYKWLIMQFDLRRSHLPHMFIAGKHYDTTFYANLFLAFTKFDDITSFFTHADAQFSKQFKVFSAGETVHYATNMLVPQLTAALAQHYNQFDYEINDDHLLIYAAGLKVVTIPTLNDMLRVGMWLADYLNQPAQDKGVAHGDASS